MSDDGWTQSQVKIRKIHEFYLCVILIAIIVGTFSVKWYEISKLTELLNFGLTLSSLILAVFAIAFAIYSNGTIESTVSSLVSASRDVQRSATNLDLSTGTLQEDIRSLSEVTGAIRTQIDGQTTRLDAITSQLETTREDANAGAIPGLKPNDVERFLKGSSILGCYAMLATAYAFENSISIQYRELFEGGAGVKPDYIHGYLIAAKNAGVLKATITQSSVRDVTGFPLTSQTITNAIDDKAERISEGTTKIVSETLALVEQRIAELTAAKAEGAVKSEDQ